MPGVAEALQRRVQPFVAAHKFGVYAFLSVAAVLAITVNALRGHSNFYSVTVYLSRNSRTLIVLANFGFLTALICGRIMQKIFFGPLLPAEVERLYDRTWFFITGSLLAFTIFRDEFDVSFSLMFGFLLFVKCFHWLMADRIEWMDQRPYPGPPPIFHIRIMSLFCLLATTDLVMFMLAYQSIMQNDIGATILFANEYAILAVSAWNAFSKYSLTVYELRRASTRGGADAPPWEAKSSWIFYIELITDAIKLFTYSVFFAVITAHFGLPLNLIWDLYMTTASFFSRVTAFQRYRSATRDMDQRYPNASAAELAATDGTCIICREEMILPAPDAPAQPADGPNMTPKKLPCGHIFHFSCLRSWLERQQNCPTCRRTVMDVATPANGNQAQRVPQQGQANGGLPPPPQRPAGQAQPWGLFAQEQAAQQQNQAQGGMVGGLMRRLIGAAAGPPLVPGQFGNAPLAQQPGVPAQPVPGAVPAANAGRNGAAPAPGGQQRPPALVFEYNYVHEFGQPPRLMAPPMLQGFYREDGLWQGWPGQARVDARANPQAGAPPAPAVAPAPTQTTPAGSANSSSEVTVPPDSSESAQDSSTTSTTDTSSSSTFDRAETPREAAARAALRRFGGPAPTTSSPGPATPTTSTTPVRPADAGALSSETSTAVAPSVPSVPTPTPTTTAPPLPTASRSTGPAPPTSTATQAPGNRVALPSVIPLYDFGRNPGPRPTSTPATQRSPMAAPPRFNFGNQPPLQQRTQAAPRAAGQPGPSTRLPPRPSQFMRPSNGPIGRLPAQLTEEELHRMDRLTRDAIDERIRVLEGVNGAVYRCLEELLRMRSVLPPLPASSKSNATPAATTAGTTGAADPGAAASEPSREATEDVKGKGKEVTAEQASTTSASITAPSTQTTDIPAEPASEMPALPRRLDSLPLAATIVPTGAPAGQIPPLVAPAPEISADGAVVADQIAAAAGAIAELEPLANEIDTAQPGAAAAAATDPDAVPVLLAPQVNTVSAEPEALPGVDGVPLAEAGQQPGDENRDEVGLRAEGERREPEEPPVVADGANGDSGSGEEVGGRWETVDNTQTHAVERIDR